MDQMIVVGKYFNSNKQYVNVMKVNKKYQELVEKYEVYPLIDYWPTKEKWEITIDVMMIIGKYFHSSRDYVNMMKLTKKFKQLVTMYHLIQ